MNIITVTGIRPDFIRMSKIFKKFDQNFNHLLIHTGQHYEKMLSDVFFQELSIRRPDYNLGIGGPGKKHYHQMADLSVSLLETIERDKLNPDWIVFLGDSNSVTSAVSLKKEGYKVAHIEAGMRSYDGRMLEETNRVVCDHCSDLLFVYHDDYKAHLIRENIDNRAVHVVGNTIVEVYREYQNRISPRICENSKHILLDIHRPENFNYPERLVNIVEFAKSCQLQYGLPVKMLAFQRTMNKVQEFGIDLGMIEVTGLMSYIDFLQAQSDSLFMISDSGTAQEEPALIGTPVLVPRDYTERPQSVDYNCSFMVNANHPIEGWYYEKLTGWVNTVNDGRLVIDPSWLGDGTTSHQIVDILSRI